MPIAETVFIVMAFLMAAIFAKVPIPYTVILVLIGASLQCLAEQIAVLEPLQHLSHAGDNSLHLPSSPDF